MKAQRNPVRTRVRAKSNPDTKVAPAVYAYTQQAMTIGNKTFPETHYFHLTETISGHVVKSTLSERTLLKLGYTLPPIPHKNIMPRAETERIPLDDIIAKVPPMYKLNWLEYEGANRTHRLKPAVAIQMFPAGGFTNVNFKHWGFDTYDVHIAFPTLRHLSVPLEALDVTCVNYQIVVLGEDGGPSVSGHYQHKFKTPVCLGLNGVYAYHKIFRFYRALEHLPKLPLDWQYMQFVG